MNAADTTESSDSSSDDDALKHSPYIDVEKNKKVLEQMSKHKVTKSSQASKTVSNLAAQVKSGSVDGSLLSAKKERASTVNAEKKPAPVRKNDAAAKAPSKAEPSMASEDIASSKQNEPTKKQQADAIEI